jgi:hypothetical protein
MEAWDGSYSIRKSASNSKGVAGSEAETVTWGGRNPDEKKIMHLIFIKPVRF